MSTEPNQKGNTLSTIALVLRQSFSGQHQDYTTGSIRRAVVMLSIPMILEMCMESVFGIVDIFFVGRIGQDAVTTVALTESAMYVVYSIAVGLSMAATALVARRVGEKNPEEASHTAAQSIVISLAITVVISLVGAFLAPHLLGIMGASATTVAIGTGYTRLVFAGCLVIMLLYLINGIFRGAGNAAMAMWSLWIANGCNIILCPILIHYYGLPGAAIATIAGRGIGVCYQLFYLFRGNGIIRIVRKQFRPDGAIIKGLTKVASTGTAQFLVGTASWIAMTRIIMSFNDTAATAGYQVSIRILLFFLLPAWGMSNAAATLVGQNLGAGSPERAERSVRTASIYNAVFMLLVSLLFAFAAAPIVGFVNRDPAVVEVAINSLRIISIGYVFYGVGMVLTNAFNGAGDTSTPTIINLFCCWLFQIPLAWSLAIALKLGPKGVFLAILITETTIAIVSFIVFRRGKWKRVKV
ncbi:MATE family efflux transporter [Puia dinghuensis]|uniref:Multidrug-efflux transporter n=1 Tax=Puia dinghuensis TaxID=1792502 RepID=A0A8J2UG74_9BACT|nr:MATE family efflux transporter [Puia dinghuensis]GGB11310.1 MATE family efflux transporter [Puia dinghuensis]